MQTNQTNHLFLIDSDSFGHRLSVDGEAVGKFRTLKLAEAKATEIGRLFVPEATLRFEMDFKWTLSEVEIRAAMLEC